MVNGVSFPANGVGSTGWFPATSNSATATSLATAINASSTTTGVVASAAGSVVSATATVVGTGPNSYATFSSSQAPLTISPYISSSPVTGSATGTMLYGTNAGYSYGGTTIQLTGNNFVLGQSVYVSTTGNVALSPLAWGSTYYVIPGANGSIQLATTSTGAVAGAGITFTSSQTKTTADTFTLNPSALVGTPSAQWVVSNDNTNWIPYTTTPFNITISSLTYSSYVATGTVNIFDFGHMNYGWIGLKTVAPTSGAVSFSTHLIGKGD